MNLTNGQSRIFRTPHIPIAKSDGKLRTSDVALATAAAPIYFKPHRIGSNVFADGGLVANVPDPGHVGIKNDKQSLVPRSQEASRQAAVGHGDGVDVRHDTEESA